MCVQSQEMFNEAYDASDYLDMCGDGDLAMLKAYFDESGIHNPNGICVVAGFIISSKGAWELSQEWQSSLLFKYKIPEFHAKDFSGRKGNFLGWDDEKVRDFSIDAVAIINSCVELNADAFVASAVRSKDFFALSIDERRWLTGGQYVHSNHPRMVKWKKQGAPSKPYFLLFQRTVYDAVYITQNKSFAGKRLGTGDVINFVFDQQHQYEATAKAIFLSMRKMPPLIKERLGDVVFSSRKRAVPLQVADFIAHESFCYLTRREVRGVDYVTNQTARLLGGFREWRSSYSFINSDVLARYLAESPPTPELVFRPQWNNEAF